MNDRTGADEPAETGPEDRSEALGSVSEEAAKLFSAFGDWARHQGDDLGHVAAAAAGQASRAAHQIDEHVATGAPECTWCPLCRTMHVLRETSPDVRDQLMVAATALLQAGAGLLTSLQDGRAAESRTPPDHDRRGSVERIDLDDTDDPDDLDDLDDTDDWKA